MKFCYNTSSTFLNNPKKSRSVSGRCIFLGLFWKENNLSYNRRNTIYLFCCCGQKKKRKLLTSETVYLQMRLFMMSHLIWFYTVCPLVFEFSVLACSKHFWNFAGLNFVICFFSTFAGYLKLLFQNNIAQYNLTVERAKHFLTCQR